MILDIYWRRRSESNRRIKVLQTSALPLGYAATRLIDGFFSYQLNLFAAELRLSIH